MLKELNTQPIVSLFIKQVEKFTKQVEDKFDLKDLKSLLSLVSFETKSKKNIDSDEEIVRCHHEFLKGKSAGETCPNRVCAESKTGKYCKRHLGNEDDAKEKKAKSKAKNAKSAKSKKLQDEAESEMTAIKKLNENKPKLIIKRNSFGNYEHADTQLVMNKETRKVIGKQQEDGSISILTAEDIDNCKLYKLAYDLPNNLTSEKDKEEKEEIIKTVEKEEDDDEEEDEDSE